MIRTMTTSLAMIALLAAPVQAQFRESGVTSAAPTNSSSSAATNSGSGGGFLGGILGCSAEGGKQGTGAVIGGVVGAVLGNRIAGRGSRTLGTLLGGALGAAAGSAVGCKLQKNDRDKAERAAQDALETGEAQSWSNADTGASGHVEVTDASVATGPALAGLKFPDGVEPAGNFSKVGDSFTTRSAATLRSGPSTAATVRGTLPAGMRVWVPAQVTSQPWMLVAERGVALGYVSSSLLTRSTTVAASNCKMVTQSVSVPGETEQSESYQACKGSDGAWTMTRV
ncbi:MAG TPA: SH3 domain-containing protein [Sphingobium sp.]